MVEMLGGGVTEGELITLPGSLCLVMTVDGRIAIVLGLRGCGERRGAGPSGEGARPLGPGTVRASLVSGCAFFAERLYPILGPKGSSSLLMGGVIPPQRRRPMYDFRATGEPGRGVRSPDFSASFASFADATAFFFTLFIDVFGTDGDVGSDAGLISTLGKV